MLRCYIVALSMFLCFTLFDEIRRYDGKSQCIMVGVLYQTSDKCPSTATSGEPADHKSRCKTGQRSKLTLKLPCLKKEHSGIFT